MFSRMQSNLMFRVGHSRNSGKFFLFNPKSWALESVIPASYPGQFALSELTRGGLEPSAIGEVSRQAWQVTSNPKSPRTTGNEAAVIRIPLTIGIRTPSSTGKESEIQYWNPESRTVSDSLTRGKETVSVLNEVKIFWICCYIASR